MKRKENKMMFTTLITSN